VVVFLSGFVGRWQDVEELAQGVRRLPGVQAVILEHLKVAAVPIGPGGQ
jgi:osmotically-inducible protein OsmY